MIIKLHTSQKVTAGLHGGREENGGGGLGGGAGKGWGSWRESKGRKRQKDKDECVGEMIGINRKMGQDCYGPSWTQQNVLTGTNGLQTKLKRAQMRPSCPLQN